VAGSRPRVPGGYFDMPRHLLDAIAAAPGMTGAQLRIVLVIMRLTWGYYPDKNRDGAGIKRRVLAERTGLSKRTIDKAMPPLVREGMVQEVEPPTGRRPPVLRVNPNPAEWGGYAPVEYATEGTQAPVESAQIANRTQSTPAGVPRVRRQGHSTASHSPSSHGPSSHSPSSPPKPSTTHAEFEVTTASDPCEDITTPRLRDGARKFMERLEKVTD
jgi:hypothetical protein